MTVAVSWGHAETRKNLAHPGCDRRHQLGFDRAIPLELGGRHLRRRGIRDHERTQPCHLCARRPRWRRLARVPAVGWRAPRDGAQAVRLRSGPHGPDRNGSYGAHGVILARAAPAGPWRARRAASAPRDPTRGLDTPTPAA